MIFPELAGLSDLALLILRLLIAAIFASSGWSHARNPRERAESVGLPVPATFVLGVVEVVGAALLVLGLWVQVAAAALMAVMAGALYKKIFVWKKGFWGEGDGWYYDLLYAACNFVFLTVGPGSIALG